MPEGFLAEHPGAGAVIVDLLMAALVLVGLALIRMKFNHIKEEQVYQNRRLGKLEERMGDSDQTDTGTEKTLEHIVQRLDEAIDEQREYRKENKDEHKEILTQIRNGHAEAAT